MKHRPAVVLSASLALSVCLHCSTKVSGIRANGDGDDNLGGASGDGDGDSSSGDGDGDSSSGDGDGDSSSGDGDGDGDDTSGDGDGDSNGGDGDGDTTGTGGEASGGGPSTGGGGGEEPCSDGDERLAPGVSCGLNDRGAVHQTCQDGAWGGDVCEDPDVCEDGAAETIVCEASRAGRNVCLEGTWLEGPCLPTTMTRVSVTSSGAAGLGNSFTPVISWDGSIVAFTSYSDLTGDGASLGDIHVYVHDVSTGTTSLVSESIGGGPAESGATLPVISADGRFVVFESYSADLVVNDTNSASDVFLYDRDEDTLVRVSVTSTGAEVDGTSFQPHLSADGRFIAFLSTGAIVEEDVNGVQDVYVHDRTTGETTLVSVSSSGAIGNDSSYTPRLSGDGGLVLYRSDATNLVADDVEGQTDLFLHDRANGQTTRLSETEQGAGVNEEVRAGYEITADGRFVLFGTPASNLVPNHAGSETNLFLIDRSDGAISQVDSPAEGTTPYLIDSSISDSGQFVVFNSTATGFVPSSPTTNQIYLFNRSTGSFRAVSRRDADIFGDDDSLNPSVAGGGGYVVFSSEARNLLAGPQEPNSIGDIYWAPL